MSTMRLCLLIAAFATLAVGSTSANEASKPFVAGSWAKLRAAYPDTALVVHFWGLTCAPCRTEMPHWGELHARKPGIPIVFVHAERPPPKLKSVNEFIRRSGLADADTWHFADSFTDRLRFEISREWHGEMPLTMLIDRHGHITTQTGSADFDEIGTWISAQRHGAGR